MTHLTQSFAIADPRTFDGDPYEVAERAVAQLQGLLTLVEQATGPTLLMVRNAELERQLAAGEDPNVKAFEDSLQGRRWVEFRARVQAARNDLNILRRVAGFNPRAAGR
jgi:hypothetical protein